MTPCIEWLHGRRTVHRVTQLAGRSRGVSMAHRLHKLGQYVRGWMAYYGCMRGLGVIPREVAIPNLLPSGIAPHSKNGLLLKGTAGRHLAFCLTSLT